MRSRIHAQHGELTHAPQQWHTEEELLCNEAGKECFACMRWELSPDTGRLGQRKLQASSPEPVGELAR